jgi:hypothetical protein
MLSVDDGFDELVTRHVLAMDHAFYQLLLVEQRNDLVHRHGGELGAAS